MLYKFGQTRNDPTVNSSVQTSHNQL